MDSRFYADCPVCLEKGIDKVEFYFERHICADRPKEEGIQLLREHFERVRSSKTYAGGIQNPLEESPGTQSREDKGSTRDKREEHSV